MVPDIARRSTDKSSSADSGSSDSEGGSTGEDSNEAEVVAVDSSDVIIHERNDRSVLIAYLFTLRWFFRHFFFSG